MHKENKLAELKKAFLLKENEYKLRIYKLEAEIKGLTTLLDQNKIYYNKYIDLSKEIGKNRRENEDLKIKFHKELQENNLQILVEKDLREELDLKIEKLNNELNEMHEEKNDEKKINVEMQSLIKKLRIEINERDENIMMLNEELEIYIRKYSEEKSKYFTTLKDLKLLENKVKLDNELRMKKEIENQKENEKQAENPSDNSKSNQKNKHNKTDKNSKSNKTNEIQNKNNKI